MSIHAMSSKQASAVKRGGHKREEKFNRKMGYDDAEINWSGSSADCLIDPEKLSPSLEEWITKKGISLEGGVSMKGGTTLQFHLGNIPELTDKQNYSTAKNNKGQTCVDHGISFEDQLRSLRSPEFWSKYLRKGELLCYEDEESEEYNYFKMSDVISYICGECDWRILPTGRLKGDFHGKQILTYEYRKKKKSFVLGAHGGENGKKFIKLLKDKIDVLVESSQ